MVCKKSTTLTHRKQNLFWYATKYQAIMHFTTLYLQSKPSYHQNWISTGWWRWSNKVIKHQPSRQTALLQSYPEWMKTKKLLKHCQSTNYYIHITVTTEREPKNSLGQLLNGKEDVCVKIKTKELKEITSFQKTVSRDHQVDPNIQ